MVYHMAMSVSSTATAKDDNNGRLCSLQIISGRNYLAVPFKMLRSYFFLCYQVGFGLRFNSHPARQISCNNTSDGVIEVRVRFTMRLKLLDARLIEYANDKKKSL